MLAPSGQNRVINPPLVPVESKPDMQNSPMFSSSLNFKFSRGFFVGFGGLAMKSRIQNYTQMTKSLLLSLQSEHFKNRFAKTGP